MKTEKQFKLPKEVGESWVNLLRNTPETKRIRGNYKDYNGCFCGFGIGLKAVGVSFSDQLIESPLPAGMSYIEHEIVQLNDDLNMSFKEQADWIEENVEFV